MSIFKKIKNAVTGEELMRNLCEHLRQIGVNATLLESGSPEAIGPRWKKGPFVSEYVFGNIKIEGQHIDLLQVGRVLKVVETKADQYQCIDTSMWCGQRWTV